MTGRRYEIDMCSGPILSKIIRFAFPLWITFLMQQTFHAADMIVIGRFASHESMAAIGTTGDLLCLLLNLEWGVCGGANVLASQAYGAKDHRALARTVHTAIAIAVIFGLSVMVFGLVAAYPLMRMLKVPAAIIDRSVLYLRIRFAGVPFLLTYNFGYALLRSIGDTRRPLYYLTAAGILNVLLNLLFVIVFKMDVAGVALATVLSNILSMSLMLRALITMSGPARLIPKQIKIYWPVLKKMLWIGIPTGLQGASYSLSNVIIQKSLNTFGPAAIAGFTSEILLEALPHTLSTAMYHTTVTFTGQNYGRKDYKRMARGIWICLACSVVSAGALGWGMYFSGEALLGLINANVDVIRNGMIRLRTNLTTYFLMGAMEVFNSGLRGTGRSVAPAISTFTSICILRVVWVYTAFRLNPTLETLVISYPLSWLVVVLWNGGMLFFVCRGLLRGKGGGDAKYAAVKTR